MSTFDYFPSKPKTPIVTKQNPNELHVFSANEGHQLIYTLTAYEQVRLSSRQHGRDIFQTLAVLHVATCHPRAS